MSGAEDDAVQQDVKRYVTGEEAPLPWCQEAVRWERGRPLPCGQRWGLTTIDMHGMPYNFCRFHAARYLPRPEPEPQRSWWRRLLRVG